MEGPVEKLREVRRDLAGLKRAFEQAPIAPARELVFGSDEAEELVGQKVGEGLAIVIAQLIAKGDLPEDILDDPGKLSSALVGLLRQVASHPSVLKYALRRLKRRGVGQEIRLVRRSLSRVS